MNSKKGLTTASRTVSTVQVRDTFQTPNYAVDLLVPFIPKSITSIWEPACGDGKIATRLAKYSYTVFMTDIRKSDIIDNVLFNFITEKSIEFILQNNCAIITNPPFSLKAEFVEKAFEYDLPFALLISAEYSGQQIDWVERGCEKIIPTRRVNYITPHNKLSSAQFHTMWLTYKFELGRTETFVDLPIKEIKENI